MMLETLPRFFLFHPSTFLFSSVSPLSFPIPSFTAHQRHSPKHSSPSSRHSFIPFHSVFSSLQFPFLTHFSFSISKGAITSSSLSDTFTTFLSLLTSSFQLKIPFSEFSFHSCYQPPSSTLPHVSITHQNFLNFLPSFLRSLSLTVPLLHVRFTDHILSLPFHPST